MISAAATYIFELRGQPLVLFSQLADQKTLLSLRLSLVDLSLLEDVPQARDVCLELGHLQIILLLHPLQPSPEVIFLLLQFLNYKQSVVSGMHSSVI